MNFVLLSQPLLAASAGQTLVIGTSVLASHTVIKIQAFSWYGSLFHTIIMIIILIFMIIIIILSPF